jgi:hypothetical protein
MNSAAAALVRLGLYDTIALVPVSSFPAGNYLFQSATCSNSLLSTIWVKSLDSGAAVASRWYDVGPGSGSFPGEKIYIAAHKNISTADTSDRRLIPGIHNKAFLEVSITGGDAVFGVYVTAVSSFPQEAPFKDGQDALPSSDAGSGLSILDRAQDKWFFLSGPQGAINAYLVGGSVGADPAGDPFIFSARTDTNPNNYQTLISQTVPAGKLWKIRQANVICRAGSEYQIYADSVIIGEGKTGAAETNSTFPWAPYSKLLENKIVELKFRQNRGAIQDVSAYLQITQEDL